jgi:hypothetical protein
MKRFLQFLFGAFKRQPPSPEHFSEAWLLESIFAGYDGQGVTLKQIIQIGDFINRAIFGLQELRQAALSLCKLGLIEVAKERFYLTPEGLKICRNLKAETQSHWEHLKLIEKRLARLKPARSQSFEESLAFLTPTNLQRGYAEHSKEIEGYVEQHLKKN